MAMTCPDKMDTRHNNNCAKLHYVSWLSNPLTLFLWNNTGTQNKNKKHLFQLLVQTVESNVTFHVTIYVFHAARTSDVMYLFK